MTFANCEGRECWPTILFSKLVFEDTCLTYQISFSLPGPLRTAFEQNNALPTTTNQPDATALTENAIKWLKLPKNIKISFEKKSPNPKTPKLQIWGAISSALG